MILIGHLLRYLTICERALGERSIKSYDQNGKNRHFWLVQLQSPLPKNFSTTIFLFMVFPHPELIALSFAQKISVGPWSVIKLFISC